MIPHLRITAVATAPNPIPQMSFSLPYEFGFGIYLPHSQSQVVDEQQPVYPSQNATLVEVAQVVTAPIELRGQERVAVHINGFVQVEPDALAGEGGGSADESPLSGFLRNYMRGLDSPIIVKGLSYLPWNSTISRGAIPSPPRWITDIVRSLELNVTFPGPKPAPKLIRSVTIQDMRISESRGHMTASGLVLAEIQLPSQMKRIDVDVQGVLPDILVFDGYPPEGEDIDPDELPYPPHAFGRICPDQYLLASSERSEEEDDVLIVRAPIHDVPVQVLAGRDRIMSDFVSKIIFRGGARAGIKGRAAVSVMVGGMTSRLDIDRIPVLGDVVVGKPRLG
jgi:hypothetical protein